MPDLPTLTLSQAHYDRVVAAFPGTTLAEKAANYRNWLTNNLIDFVEVTEVRAIEDTYNAQKTAKIDALRAGLLPIRQPFPIGT